MSWRAVLQEVQDGEKEEMQEQDLIIDICFCCKADSASCGDVLRALVKSQRTNVILLHSIRFIPIYL